MDCKKSSGFLFCVVLLAFSALLFGPSCGRKLATEQAEAEQVLENFTAFETDSGEKVWDLTASKACIQKSETEVVINDFRVRFFGYARKDASVPGKNTEGNLESVMTAKLGRIDVNQNNFSTEGATRIVTSDGETLDCKDLSYVAAQRRIFTDSEFTLVRKDSTIRGKGLEATPDLSVVIVKNNSIVLRETAAGASKKAAAE